MGRVVVLGLAQRRPRRRRRAPPRSGRDDPGRRGAASGSPAARVATRPSRRPQRARTSPWSAAVGDDEGGRAYVERLRSRGVDVTAVRTADGAPTGQAWITVDDEGENAIVVIPGANGQVAPEGLSDALAGLGAGDVLLLQLEVPVRTVAAAARLAHGAGARVVLNAAPYAALPHDVAALADPLVVNEHEALQLADSDAAAHLPAGDLRRRGVQLGRRAVTTAYRSTRLTWSTRPGRATRSAVPLLRRWHAERTGTRRSGQRARPGPMRCGTAARSSIPSSDSRRRGVPGRRRAAVRRPRRARGRSGWPWRCRGPPCPASCRRGTRCAGAR